MGWGNWGRVGGWEWGERGAGQGGAGSGIGKMGAGRVVDGEMVGGGGGGHSCLKCCIYGYLAFGRATPGAWGEYISTEMLDV